MEEMDEAAVEAALANQAISTPNMKHTTTPSNHSTTPSKHAGGTSACMQLVRATCECSTRTGLLGTEPAGHRPGSVLTFVGEANKFLGMSQGNLVVSIDSVCCLLIPPAEVKSMLMSKTHDVVVVSSGDPLTLECLVQRRSRRSSSWLKRYFVFDAIRHQVVYFKDANKQEKTMKGPGSIRNISALKLTALVTKKKSQLMDEKPTVYQLEATFDHDSDNNRRLEWKGDWQTIHKIAVILSRCSIQSHRCTAAKAPRDETSAFWNRRTGQSPTRPDYPPQQQANVSSNQFEGDDLQARIDRLHNRQLESKQKEIVSAQLP